MPNWKIPGHAICPDIKAALVRGEKLEEERCHNLFRVLCRAVVYLYDSNSILHKAFLLGVVHDACFYRSSFAYDENKIHKVIGEENEKKSGL